MVQAYLFHLDTTSSTRSFSSRGFEILKILILLESEDRFPPDQIEGALGLVIIDHHVVGQADPDDLLAFGADSVQIFRPKNE